MKKILILIIVISLQSCSKPFQPLEDFDCNTSVLKNLEEVEDSKNLFSLELPKDWETNLYQDQIQSSIFSADTSKNLTESILLDVSYINKELIINENFILKQEQEYLQKKLIMVENRVFNYNNTKAIYMIFKGKKNNLKYQICSIFIHLNSSNFVLAKIELYGDEAIAERRCKALSLIENIKLNQY
ncbi:hypothetical protein [Polaribacter sp. P097]|uniref:hypothetical protein n=1 Tax=Polaribacter sp. P097 TaxID=3117398 RepID=UPI002FE40776